jgi:hypothetical protein
MLNKELIIRGGSFRINKLLLTTLATVVLALYMIYQRLFSEQSFIVQKFQEYILALAAMICMTAFFYWMLSDEYYYYQVYPDHIEVRNVLKPYRKVLLYSGLLKIKVSGYQRIFRNLPDSIEFIYQPTDERENIRFQSFGFTEEDWKLLLKSFKDMDLPVECSHDFLSNA